MREARSEGERQLRALDASLAELAGALGCARSSVSDWRRGVKLPSAAARERLEEELGIPVTAWLERPRANTGEQGANTSENTPATSWSARVPLPPRRVLLALRAWLDRVLAEDGGRDAGAAEVSPAPVGLPTRVEDDDRAPDDDEPLPSLDAYAGEHSWRSW